MKAEKLWKIGKAGVFVLILVFMVNGLSGIFERKTAITKNGAYMEEPEAYDVLFFGTSKAINGVFPLELWKDYGIASYNLATHGLQMPSTYWAVRNVLDYSTPDLIVIDCSGVSFSGLVGGNYLHTIMDIFPLSKTKVAAVMDVLDNFDQRLEYLWNFYLYHGRWTELKAGDFRPEDGNQMGAEMRVAVAKPDLVEKTTEKFDGDSVGVEYLRKIMEETKEKGVEVLLMYLPYPANIPRQKEANYLYDFAKEYGVRYLNFLDTEGVVDFETDCWDSSSHLNPSGARKVTDYLGNYIEKNYEITKRMDEDTIAKWTDAYEKYVEIKTGYLKSEMALNNYLMLLADKNLSAEIYIKEGSKVLEDEQMQKLLKNAEAEGMVKYATEPDKEYLAEAEAALEKLGQKDEERPAWEKKLASEVQITVRDGQSGAVLDRAGFSVQGISGNRL